MATKKSKKGNKGSRKKVGGKKKTTTTKNKKEKVARIPNGEFVAIWQESDNLDAIVESTGYAKGSLISRAITLRNMGVNLKKFPRAKKEVDVKELNKIIKELK